MHIHPRRSFPRSAFALVAVAVIVVSAREASATWPVEAGSAGLNKAMDGWCSLPEAIEAVNLGTKTAAGATHFDCVNSGGGTDIMLEGVWWARYRTFGATITKSTSIYAWLIDGEPVVEDSGPVTLRIDGTNPDGTPIDVWLFSIKLEHSGAARGRVLENRAHLLLYETVISGGNVQGNSGQDGDGGGILNLGNLEIQKSIITNNRANRGGGIFSASVVGTGMYEVTIDNNNASQQGGGIYSAGRLFVVRTTISSNVAAGNGGGVFAATADNAYCELFFTTVAFNRGATGGGVFINSTSVNTVTNGSIVGSNVRTNNTLDDYSGFPNRHEGEIKNDGVRNLYRTGLGVQSPAPMDLIGFDPQLGMLTHFNGSFTRTHPLAPGSPARDVALVGSQFNDGYDQNYESRPEPGADLGSFEVQ
jgi:predicted outer membrane repeat protein